MFKVTVDAHVDGQEYLESLDFSFVKLLEEVSQGFVDSYFKTPHEGRLNMHLSLIDDTRMLELNNEYRGLKKTTDVLSFPLFDNLRDQKSLPKNFPEMDLGDIFISWNVALKQADEFSLKPWEELLHLYVHGFLHTFGFDHELSFEEEKLMEEWEKKIIIIGKNALKR